MVTSTGREGDINRHSPQLPRPQVFTTEISSNRFLWMSLSNTPLLYSQPTICPPTPPSISSLPYTPSHLLPCPHPIPASVLPITLLSSLRAEGAPCKQCPFVARVRVSTGAAGRLLKSLPRAHSSAVSAPVFVALIHFSGGTGTPLGELRVSR